MRFTFIVQGGADMGRGFFIGAPEPRLGSRSCRHFRGSTRLFGLVAGRDFVRTPYRSRMGRESSTPTWGHSHQRSVRPRPRLHRRSCRRNCLCSAFALAPVVWCRSAEACIPRLSFRRRRSAWSCEWLWWPSSSWSGRSSWSW